MRTRVKELRKARRLTQTQLAELSGVAQSTISRIERERYDGEVETLRQIAASLGVSLGELFPDPGLDNVAIEKRFSALSDADRQAVLALMDALLDRGRRG